jgi:hypothetical protein
MLQTGLLGPGADGLLQPLVLATYKKSGKIVEYFLPKVSNTCLGCDFIFFLISSFFSFNFQG